jgi:ABC-type dipeptide/oligopeptide/nickel transport system ATPase subunit
MIKILKIHIEEFRGIRTLDLNLDGKSFVVHGPNGSGKSDVVDAIGFALSGTIARLTGAGTGGITVQKHGPHIYKRDDPASAKVLLTFEDPASGQTGMIERTVKNPTNFKLTPDTPELRTALEAVEQHPELTLSRREIIKFILSEAGKRAVEVQALLQLDSLNVQRKALKSAVTKVAKDVTTTESALNNARGTMSRHLDIPKLVPSEVLRIVNEKRSILGLVALEDVALDTDFKQGVEDQPAEVPFDKPSAVRDVEAFKRWLEEAEERDAAFDELKGAILALGQDGAILESLKHRSFVQAGKSLVFDDGVCPLCDTQWDSPELLMAHLDEKIALSQEAARLEEVVKTAASTLVSKLLAARGGVKPVRELSISWGSPETQMAIQSWDDGLLELSSQLSTVPAILELRERLQTEPLPVPEELPAELGRLLQVVQVKPDTGAKAQARSHLIIAAERWTVLRLSRAANNEARAAHESASMVYQTFCEVADEALTALYNEVEGRFSEFYRQINAEDESAFKADLSPRPASLISSLTSTDWECFRRGRTTAKVTKTAWACACTLHWSRSYLARGLDSLS